MDSQTNNLTCSWLTYVQPHSHHIDTIYELTFRRQFDSKPMANFGSDSEDIDESLTVPEPLDEVRSRHALFVPHLII